MNRVSTAVMRRCFHNTSASRAAEKLPFEKPIYESELLSKAKAEKESIRRFAFYCDLAVITVGISVLARVGYYVVYGKENGAKALPRRSEQ